ncbi:hypothetical protein MWN34_14005 [Ancylobacter sp. 6x-1]|uniref:DUF883 domain-containing protein n=1 Tax=Ancylobacter crimeensis TaxID=2579147 RepID=A0ABT0DDS2_9HYPH|nr:hypothetical protein [Ancylobacter crimeensis]MCK0198024.1 hypothetical protein [Ancylobacter crimeensis]
MAEPSVQQDFSKLSDDLATLRADVAKLADTLTALAKSEGEAVSSAVRSKVRSTRARAEATATNLLDEGSAALEDAKERAQNLSSDVTACIERNPIGAVVAALGVGFVFGLLTRGRD